MNNSLAAQLRFIAPLCSKPRRKFIQTSYSLKSQFIGHIFVADS